MASEQNASKPRKKGKGLELIASLGEGPRYAIIGIAVMVLVLGAMFIIVTVYQA